MIYFSDNFQIAFIEKIAELKKLDDVFYLTGSRYFNTHGNDSDWDFFVSNQNPGLHERLLNLGFNQDRKDIRYSGDRSISAVYTWGEKSTKIDIQVVYDHCLNWKRRTRTEIFEQMTILDRLVKTGKSDSPSEQLEKQHFYKLLKNEIWRTAFNSYRVGLDSNSGNNLVEDHTYQIPKSIATANMDGRVQEVSLSHVTLSGFCEAVVNVDPAAVLNTENLTSDEAHALVSSLNELHQVCVQTNNFKPYLSAIFARAGYKLDV